MEIIHLILLALHFFGLAAIIGVFLVQLRADRGFRTDILLAGAITQLVTGLGMVATTELGGGDVNHIKIGVKLVVALVVLVAAIVAAVQQRKGGRVKPWFHTAGGLAVVNVLVAVFWQ